MNISKCFANFARMVAEASGYPSASLIAATIIIMWLVLGPIFAYSDTWQLVINTGTTIVTFIMVFLIQNTQNRDSVALQIKLDELIRSHEGAHNILLDLEELTQEQLDSMKKKYEMLAQQARADLKGGGVDTKTTDI
jgi:low affinity Fe/Cu permease